MLSAAEIAAMQTTTASAMPSLAAFTRRPSTKNAMGGRDGVPAVVGGMSAVPCHVHPDAQRGSSEVEQAGALKGDERYRIIFPVGTAALKRDIVTVSGVAYELTSVDTGRSWALEVEAFAVRAA